LLVVVVITSHFDLTFTFLGGLFFISTKISDFNGCGLIVQISNGILVSSILEIADIREEFKPLRRNKLEKECSQELGKTDEEAGSPLRATDHHCSNKTMELVDQNVLGDEADGQDNDEGPVVEELLKDVGIRGSYHSAVDHVE